MPSSPRNTSSVMGLVLLAAVVRPGSCTGSTRPPLANTGTRGSSASRLLVRVVVPGATSARL